MQHYNGKGFTYETKMSEVQKAHDSDAFILFFDRLDEMHQL